MRQHAQAAPRNAGVWVGSTLLRWDGRLVMVAPMKHGNTHRQKNASLAVFAAHPVSGHQTLDAALPAANSTGSQTGEKGGA